MSPKKSSSESNTPSADADTEIHSRVMSSCELFSMLKVLAAGRGARVGPGVASRNGEQVVTPSEDIQSEESTDDDAPLPEEGRLRRASTSSATTHVEHQADWVKDEMERVESRNQAIADKFTALSLGQEGPIQDDPSTSPQTRTRPILPRLDSKQAPFVEPCSPTDKDDNDTKPIEPTDEQKLKAIQEEFGEIAQTVALPGEEPEAERMLASSTGILFKGIMLVGSTHLTTHRLLFHAPLPPDEAYVRKYVTEGSDTAFNKPVSHSDILHSGPVTWHRSGPLTHAQRVWLELSAEMLSTYPSADDAGRTRPLRSILLSSIRNLEPLDPNHPSDFHITYEGQHHHHSAHFTVDTEQSAMQWRRDLESALYRLIRSSWRKHVSYNGQSHLFDSTSDTEWSMLRYCVPLDRITLNGISDYHGFARITSLDVALEKGQRTLFDTERIAEGNYHAAMAGRGDGAAKLASVRTAESGGPGSPKRFSLSKLGRSGSGSRSPSRSSIDSTHLQHPHPHPHEHTRHLSPLHPRELCRVLTPNSRRTPASEASDDDSHEALHSDDAIVPGADTPELSEHDSSSEAEQSVNSVFNFNLVILNDSAWFSEALETACAAAHERRQLPNMPRAKTVLNIAGLNGLATDEEIEAATANADAYRQESADSAAEMIEAGAVFGTQGGAVKAARKAEKAHLAARVFGLQEEEGIWLKRGYVIHNGMPMRGHIILTPRYVCFWRRMLMSPDIKYRFKCADIKAVTTGAAHAPPGCGMALQLHGHHDVHFDFWQQSARDEVVSRIEALIEAREKARESTSKQESESVAQSSFFSSAAAGPTESPAIISPASDFPASPLSSSTTRSLHAHAADILAPSRDLLFKRRTMPDHLIPQLPFLANKPWLSRTATLSPRTFVCLTIGSRGDVQPYIALGVRLMKDGHKVVIVTHDEFKGWIEGYGIEHRQAGGDPTALMKLSAEHSMLSPSFFTETLGSFRGWFDELLHDAWIACKDADVLIESPSAFAGLHIAEALKIPYFRAFTMPWNRTSAYPQAFMVPAFDMGPSFNYSTYTLFDNIIWTASASQINRWRKKDLSLPATNMANMSASQVPFLYNFSEAVVPKPLDWSDAISITGYWVLEDSDKDWTPPEALERWLNKAKEDGKKVVYIGFGSIVVPKPNALTRNIIAAVEKAGVRAVIAKGWSSRGSDPAKEGKEIEFPESCYSLDKVPHGWLFPRIDAAMHHGGAGTTGASLSAGLPTIIKPFFGDQFFWAIRVAKLGVGLKAASFRTDDIADALTRATTDRVMLEKASRVGKAIRTESGVDAAVQAIQYNIVRAASDRRELSFAK